MKKRILTFLLTFSLFITTAMAIVPYSAMGRVWKTDNGKVLAYPGILLEAHFTGTTQISLNADLLSGEAVYFSIELNGYKMDDIDFRSGDHKRVIATRLDPKKDYVLKMIKLSEAWQGTLLVKSWEADEGVQWLKDSPLPTRKIMCMGDSITCGANANLGTPYITDGPHANNAGMSYGWTLARRLGAQINLISYGGKGLVRDWTGSSTEVTLPQFFERALPDDPTTTWDHSQYIPDLIIIAIGQNDFTQGIVSKSVYVPAYIKFVSRIREVYPEAKILLCSSPMHNRQSKEDSVRRDALESYISQVVEHFEKLGDEDIRFHSIDYYPGSQHDAHPTVQQHQEMAEELYEVVGPWMGWAK
jgi:lysophospholipase L1-like esterase